MFISMEPSPDSIGTCVKKLGFEMIKTKKQGKRGHHIDFEIILDPKNDQKTLMGLNYYSNSMLQTLIFATTISYVFVRTAEKNQSRVVEIEYLKRKAETLVGILDHEFFTREKTVPVP
jgi:hypothetical protein